MVRALAMAGTAVRVAVGTVALGVSALLAGGCGGNDTQRDAGRTRLRVVIQPYLVYAPLHVAQAEGIFSEHGLDVELVPMTGSEPAIPLLIDGSVDVLPGQAAPGLLNAIARGEHIRIVAERSRWLPADCSTLGLVARPGLLPAEHSSRTSLPIRRISVDKQAAMVYFIEAALARVGTRLDTLERVYVPHAAEGAALAGGDIDVAFTGEPYQWRMVRAGQAVLWIGLEDVFPRMEFTMLFFGRRLLEEERDAGARFVAALLEANRRLAAGKTARNLELVGEFLGEAPDSLAGICWPFQPSDGRIRTEYLERYQSWARQHDLIDRVAAPAELIDSGFLPRPAAPVANR